MKTNHIERAAQLIGDIDPALANVWRNVPAQRHNVVTAFHRSLAKSKSFAHIADDIAVTLRSAIDAENA